MSKTSADAIRNRVTFYITCGLPICNHSLQIDLQALGARLGLDHAPCMVFRCGQCKEVGGARGRYSSPASQARFSARERAHTQLAIQVCASRPAEHRAARLCAQRRADESTANLVPLRCVWRLRLHRRLRREGHFGDGPCRNVDFILTVGDNV